MKLKTLARLFFIAVIVGVVVARLILWNDRVWEAVNPYTTIIVAFIGIALTLMMPTPAAEMETATGPATAAPARAAVTDAADDPYHKAHVLAAQGDYMGAVREYQRASAGEPDNRRPIVEIVKIYLDHLDQPEGAIQILEQAAAKPGWSPNNQAFFMFRLSELYLRLRSDQTRAVQILRDIIHRFPDTRHSAHATHNLREIDPSLVGPTAS